MMARRGTSKRLSVNHEEAIAQTYGGVRSPSSGGAAHDYGDVRCPDKLIEAKLTGDPTRPKRSISVRVDVLEKIAKEAYAEGKRPALALRICEPNSFLADVHGYIDLIVYLIGDDPSKECTQV
jgi:hypothetical protein